MGILTRWNIANESTATAVQGGYSAGSATWATAAEATVEPTGSGAATAFGAGGRGRRVAGYMMLILVLSGILAIPLLEGAVRLFWPQRQYENWIQPNVRYGHMYKTNGDFRYPFPKSDYVMDLRTNALGFRDDEPAPYSPGVRTVLFLGDSYTVGFGMDIEERFDRKLARLCQESGYTFRFINAGVDGWGTVQESRYVQDHFDSLRPDIIVLTFCENDPYDDESFLAHEGPTHVETRQWRLFLRSHLQVYPFLSKLRWMWVHRQQVEELGLDRSPGDGVDPGQNIHISEDRWEQSLQRIRDLHAAFLRFNPNGVLLVQATSPISPDIRGHLSTLANGKDLLYVDLSKSASAIPLKERRLPYDSHWNSKMQDASARALFDFIAKQPASDTPQRESVPVELGLRAEK